MCNSSPEEEPQESAPSLRSTIASLCLDSQSLLVGDPTDCSVFYHCSEAAPAPQSCGDLMFHPRLQTCAWPRSVMQVRLSSKVGCVGCLALCMQSNSCAGEARVQGSHQLHLPSGPPLLGLSEDPQDAALAWAQIQWKSPNQGPCKATKLEGSTEAKSTALQIHQWAGSWRASCPPSRKHAGETI